MPPFLSAATRADLERLLRADAVGDDPRAAALERLSLLRAALAALESDPATLEAARDAEAAGADWSAIAAAAGLKPAAARWRWQGTDAEIRDRHDAGRKRAARPSSVPTDLPGLSVAEAADRLGVTAQAVYQQITRGRLRAETVELPDGRRYKRVFPDDPAPSDG